MQLIVDAVVLSVAVVVPVCAARLVLGGIVVMLARARAVRVVENDTASRSADNRETDTLPRRSVAA